MEGRVGACYQTENRQRPTSGNLRFTGWKQRLNSVHSHPQNRDPAVGWSGPSQ